METKQATSEKSKRLIDPDDFLKWVIKRFKCVPLVGSCDNDSESMKLLIAQAPTVDAAEVVRGMWIPVTERLPEHCVTVLSYDGRDYRTVKTDSYDHCFECWLSDMDDILDRNTVTHWMPLPEPPKEETHG